MKNIFKSLLIIMIALSGSLTMSKSSAQQVNVSMSVFQNSLSPYGRWVNHGNYGQVWVSNTAGFVPYQTAGHWAYTDYGWTWVSDYDWGWAPFHYGRWAYDPSIGWYWVPGYDWAPAWVAWRNNNDYYGWAPLSPGLNISVGVGYGNQIPNNYWVFAPHQYINSPYVSRYYMPRTQNVTIIKNTTVINNVNVRNNVNYISGPRREDVERVNHSRIQTYTVSNSAKPGRTVINNNTVNVYRPVINKNQVAVGAVNNNKTVVNNNQVNKANNIKSANSNNQPVSTVKQGNNAAPVQRNIQPGASVPANKIKPINRNNDQPSVNNNNKQANVPIHKNNPVINNPQPSTQRVLQNQQVQKSNIQQRQFNNHTMQQSKPMNVKPPMQHAPSQAPHQHENGGGGHEHKPGK